MSHTMQQPLFDHFQQRIESTMALAESCSSQLPAVAERLADCFLNGRKLLIYAEQESAWLAGYAQHTLLFGSGFERPPFPALALSTGNSSAETTSALLQQQGNRGDLLLLLSASESTERCARLINQAERLGVDSISLCRQPDQLLAKYRVVLGSSQTASTPLVNLQLEALQCLFYLIDHKIFGA